MIIMIGDIEITMTIEGRGEWIIQLIHKLNRNKTTDYAEGEGEEQKSVSTADRSVGHDDYYNRRRANSNDDRRTMLLVVKINYVWVSFTRKVDRNQKH